MTLDEYEEMFLLEREKRRKRMNVVIIAGALFVITAIAAIVLVSVNRGDE